MTMRFVIVTGMSGAGKSSVLKMLEDDGYFCVDNLPVPLIQKFAQISWHEENMISKIPKSWSRGIRKPDAVTLWGKVHGLRMPLQMRENSSLSCGISPIILLTRVIF